jgi:glutamyl-tRNA synthetase
VIRFRSPTGGTVIINDLVRGRVEISNSELDDLIIARSNGVPTYNFTVVVDDADMNITHVIRGDDHLNNTPKQINMLRAMGVEIPQFAHLPMILGPDGARLSKRHGAVNVLDYKEAGYLPDALLNYLVRLGWSHGDQEIFSRDEMISLFDIVDVNASASTFNAEKLVWVNQQHIIAMPTEKLASELLPFLVARGIDPGSGPTAAQIVDAFRERARTMSEMADSCKYCFIDFDEYDPAAAKKHLRPVIGVALGKARNVLQALVHWKRDAIHQAIVSVAEGEGMNLGKLGQPIRVAITGGSVSPPLDVTLELVGQSRTVDRLGRALAYIAERAGVAADG